MLGIDCRAIDAEEVVRVHDEEVAEEVEVLLHNEMDTVKYWQEEVVVAAALADDADGEDDDAVMEPGDDHNVQDVVVVVDHYYGNDDVLLVDVQPYDANHHVEQCNPFHSVCAHEVRIELPDAEESQWEEVWDSWYS